MTKRKVAFVFAAALLAGSAISATDAAAQDATSPKNLELSTELLDLAGAKTMLTQMIDQLTPSLTQLIQQANPGKENEVSDVMNKFVMPKMKERLPEVVKEGAVIYAQHFTTDELSQLIQFYQSPLGQKLVREQPLMSKEMARVSTAWARSVAVEAVHEYSDEFKKRGLQTPI
jgi:uncharacterized protein